MAKNPPIQQGSQDRLVVVARYQSGRVSRARGGTGVYLDNGIRETGIRCGKK